MFLSHDCGVTVTPECGKSKIEVDSKWNQNGT